MALTKKFRQQILINMPSIEFVCFRGKRSIFGESLKHLSAAFQFEPVMYLLEQDYPETKDICYVLGKLLGSYMYEIYLKNLGKRSPQIITQCFEEMSLMGLGKIQLVHGLRNKILIKLFNAPLYDYLKQATNKIKTSRNHIQAGMLAGIFSKHAKANYEFKEISSTVGRASVHTLTGSIEKPKNTELSDYLEKYFLEEYFNYQDKEYVDSKNIIVDRMAKSTGITLKEGKLTLFNVVISLYPLAFFHILQHAFAKQNVPIQKYIFHAAIMQSYRACGYQKDKFGVSDNNEIITRVLEQWEMIGVGKLVLKPNSTEKKGLIEFTNAHWLNSYRKIFGKIDSVAKAQVEGAILGIYYFVYSNSNYAISINQDDNLVKVEKTTSPKNAVKFDKQLLDTFLDLTKPKYFN